MDDSFQPPAGDGAQPRDHARADERIVVKSALATMGTPEFATRLDGLAPEVRGHRKVLMGDDPALPKMPPAPALLDFYRLRLGPRHSNHLLQSATLALRAGVDDKGVLACLLHDIGLVGLVGTDHGNWGAQLVAPYVDEEVAFAIRYHQALRFFPDPEPDTNIHKPIWTSSERTTYRSPISAPTTNTRDPISGTARRG
jgi:hypothetical protein